MEAEICELTVDEAELASRVHRLAFDERLPWLAALHTPSEDAEFYRSVVFAQCRVWGAFDHNRLVAVMAVRERWIDHLYILPQSQSRGIGSKLLAIAKSTAPTLALWTFQRNEAARRFYERHGFIAVEETDGARNEEREPDVRYEWSQS